MSEGWVTMRHPCRWFGPRSRQPDVISAASRRPSEAFLASVVLAVVVAAADLTTESAVGIGFLGLAPLLTAALSGSVRETLWMTAIIVGLAIALGVPDDVFGQGVHVALVLGEVFAGLIAVYIAALRARAQHDQLRATIQYAVAATLQESADLPDAAHRLLRAIGEPLGFVAGGIWQVLPDRSLRCVQTWCADGVHADAFEAPTREPVLGEGVGIPGSVLAPGAAVWVENIPFYRGLPRAEAAAAAGLRAGVAFPLRTSGRIVGVVELLACETRPPDSAVLDLLGAVGGQIAGFLEAGRSADALSASEERKSAMLEAALDSVITIDHRGRVVELNPAAVETFGYSREDAVGREMAELIVPPDLREPHRKALARCVETGEGSLLGKRVELRAMKRDGSEFPIELTITRIGEADPPMFTGFVRDITSRQAYEEERDRLLELERVARADADQSRGQLAAILSGVADAVTAQAPDGSLLFANETAVEMLGFTSLNDLLAAPVAEVSGRFDPLDEEGRPFPTERLPGRIAIQEGRSAEAVIRFADPRDRSERWSRVKSTPVFGREGEVAMAINVIEDVTELKRSEEAQRLLAEAGRLLASSLDTDAIAQRIADLAIAPWLADWCSLHIVDSEGLQPMAAWAASDVEHGRTLAAIEERYPQDPRASIGVPNVIRTGASEFYVEMLPEHFEQGARDHTHRELLERAGPHSAIIAPIASRGRSLGAITVVRFGGGRRYDPDDVTLLEELGRRIGAWLDTAQLYAERSYIATTLQESLLPAQLPEIPGLATAARFRASGAGNEVGGDFYDLFRASDGSWSVVVGDVCGKGPDAAAVTALVRYTLRAAAMSEPSPSAALRILNEALLRQRDDLRFATVAYASLAPDNGGIHVDVASAGHPLPLLLRADGTVQPVGIEGTLAGVVPDPDLRDDAARLEKGDSLLFYTDGVTEARDETGILGETRLKKILESCVGMDVDAIASRIEMTAVEMQPGGTRDDIAVVVLQAAGNVRKAGKNG